MQVLDFSEEKSPKIYLLRARSARGSGPTRLLWHSTGGLCHGAGWLKKTIHPPIHIQDLVWQRDQFEAFGRTKDDHVTIMTKRKYLRFDCVSDWDFVPFNEASDKFLNRLVPGLRPSKVEEKVHNWQATRF